MTLVTNFICEDFMKLNQKLLYWILISIIFFISLNNNSISSNEYGKEDNLKPSVISGRIQIAYNYEWTDLKNDGLCTGSGTSLDPYIIENLEIDGQGDESCIYIDTSNIYFEIQNCTLFNADEALKLRNVQNGAILANTIYNSEYGIHLYESCDNSILSNEIFDNDFGIILHDNSEENSFQGNNVRDNVLGIYLYKSYHNSISVNNLSNNWFQGIILIHSDNNIINNNIVTFSEDGIILDHSNNSQVLWNTLERNDNGINLYISSSNQITKNIIRNNNIGINIGEQSKCNIISENNFSGNGVNIYGEQELCLQFIIPPSVGIILGILGITVTVILIRRRKRAPQENVFEEEEYEKEKLIEEQDISSEIFTEEEVPPLQELEMKEVIPVKKNEIVNEEITEKIKIIATGNLLCQFCGFKNADDAIHCVQCGQTITR